MYSKEELKNLKLEFWESFAAALALDRNDHSVPAFGALTVFTNCFEKCELFAVRAELSGHWLHLHEAAKECRNSMNFVYNHYIYIYRQLLKSTKFQLRNVKNDKKHPESLLNKEKTLRVKSA